jgi:hypothetical protein
MGAVEPQSLSHSSDTQISPTYSTSAVTDVMTEVLKSCATHHPLPCKQYSLLSFPPKAGKNDINLAVEDLPAD